MRQFLKQEVIERIKEHEPVIFDIATTMCRKYRTVIYWLTNNDIILTTSTVLGIIRKHFGYAEDFELTETREEVATA